MDHRVVFSDSGCERIATLVAHEEDMAILSLNDETFQLRREAVRSLTEEESTRATKNGFFLWTNEEAIAKPYRCIHHDLDGTLIDSFPCSCGADDDKECACLLHIEIDPNGVTHIWPYERDMEYSAYHPEWSDFQPV